MKIGPLEITLARKQAGSVFSLADFYSGQTQTVGPKSQRDALTSNVGWAFACVDAIAKRCASIPLVLYADRPGGREPIDSHIFYDLIDRPNPLFSRYDMAYLLFAHQVTAGCAIWNVEVNNAGRPVEIWPLEPYRVEKIVKGSEVVYRYQTETGTITLPSERVLEFRQPNIYNLHGSWSPLRAAGISMEVSEFLELYQYNFLHRGSWVPFAITTDKELFPEQISRVRDAWMQRLTTMRERMKPAVMHSGMKFENAPTPLDLGIAELDKASMEKVVGAFRTPKSKLGMSESANKASMFAADKAWNEEVIEPLLKMAESTLNGKLLPLYGNDRRTRGVALVAEYESPVPTDMEEIRADIDLGMRHGIFSDNEAREMLGHEPIAGGDERYKPFNLIPVSEGGSNFQEDGVGPVYVKAFKSEHEGFWSKERRDTYWQAFVKSTEAQEKIWETFLKKLLQKMKDDTLKNLPQAYKTMNDLFSGWSSAKVHQAINSYGKGVEDVVPDADEWAKVFEEEGMPMIARTLRDAGEEALARLQTGVGFNMDTTRIAEFVKMRGQEFGNVAKTLSRGVRMTLADGVADGESIEQLASRIDAIFDASWKRKQIARTEVISASNAGALEGFHQGGVEKKAWLSARDQNVRMSHLEAESMYAEGRDPGPIPIDEDFKLQGGIGPAPGQISGADENVNCRCTIIPVIDDDE